MKMSADTVDKELTEAQNAAIYSTHRSMSVVAGAGSGKTTVLVNRCRHIIGGDWAELDRLLAITFTEKAAGELKARLRPLMPAKEHYRLEGAWIGTFHAGCARMLRQHAPLIGLDPSFAIMDENAARLASRQAARLELLRLLDSKDEEATRLIDALDFRHAAGVIEDIMEFRWHARRALKNPQGADEEEKKILKALASVYARVEERLQAQFSRTGSLDFQELEIKAIQLLDENPDVLQSYRRRFKHILVDEFQDTNDAQTELVLKLFHPEVNRLCIVGDPRQSIYRFRGANIDCFATALEQTRNHGGETIHLAENFRSQRDIVSFVNECQSMLADGLFGGLKADGITSSTEGLIAARAGADRRPAVVAIELGLPRDEKVDGRRRSEADAIAALVARLVGEKKARYEDIALLFQALTDTSRYEAAFKRAQIPYRLFGGRGLLAKQEVADLMAALRYASDPSDELALLGLLRSPLVGLSDDDLVLLAGPKGENLIANARVDPRCSLLKELTEMAAHLRPSEILRRALDLTGFELICQGLDPSGGMAANIDRFIQLAASIERQEPTALGDFIDFITDLREHSARLADPPAAGDTSGAVKCMTVHAAKGLEFPVVILPDLFRKPHTIGGNWIFSRKEGIAFKIKDPLHPFGERRESDRYKTLRDAERAGDEAESKRLLYVAMTRAMDMLVLPIHPGMKGDGPWHRWLVPVVEKMRPSGVIASNTVERGTTDEGRRTRDAQKKGVSPFAFRPSSFVKAPSTLTVSQLESYARCPQEYRLKYALGLPASEIFKEGGEKMPANVRGSIVHAVLARLEPDGGARLKDIIETECIANGIYPDAKSIRTIRREIDSALALPIFSDLDSGWREVRFDWRIDGHAITGSIDWLKPSDGGLEIIDFKTDKVEKGGVAALAGEYDLQMLSYALAAEAAVGHEVCATSLVFLAPGIVHRTDMTKARREGGLVRITKIIDDIEKESFPIEGLSPPCFKCPYHHNGMCWEDRLAR